MKTAVHFIKTHPHAWWSLFMPCYLAAFFTIEHLITDNYWATQLPIDNYIPFCKYFILLYNAWAPLLMAMGPPTRSAPSRPACSRRAR